MTLLYFAILVCVVYSSDDIDKGKPKKHVKPENKNCLNPLVLTPDFKNPFPVNAQEKKEVEEKVITFLSFLRLQSQPQVMK